MRIPPGYAAAPAPGGGTGAATLFCQARALPCRAGGFGSFTATSSTRVARPVLMNMRAHATACLSPSSTSTGDRKHTSELQSPDHLVCRLLLEKKKKNEYLR